MTKISPESLPRISPGLLVSLADELLQAAFDGMVIVDTDGKIIVWNKAVASLTGRNASDVYGLHFAECVCFSSDPGGAPEQLAAHPLQIALIDHREVDNLLYLHHTNGHWIPVMARALPLQIAPGALLMLRDNSSVFVMIDQIADLRQQSISDKLTGLGNRRHLELWLELALKGLQHNERPFGVLFIDIDHFKSINDRYLHEAGDEVLREVASRISRTLRGADVLGRWGGEEFVALINDASHEELRIVAERVRQAVAEYPFNVKGIPIRVTISLGATVARAQDTIETLIERADACMYQSKQRGRNCVTLG